MNMLPALGPMIGWGESGYVFEDYNDPTKAIKIVEIRPQIADTLAAKRSTTQRQPLQCRISR